MCPPPKIVLVLALILGTSLVWPWLIAVWAVALYFYFRRNKLPLWNWMDIAGVALPLGQAIGRMANFVNQELYGLPTTLPWGITIDSAHRVAPYKKVLESVNETWPQNALSN